MPLRVSCNPKPADHRDGFQLRRLLPLDTDEPQDAVPGQQRVAVRPNCLHALVADDQLAHPRPNSGHVIATPIEENERLRLTRTSSHPPDAWKIRGSTY